MNRPAGLRGKRERLARLQEAKERLELTKRAEEEEQSGKKKPGRKPASPDAVFDHERKANITDPASRLMKTRQGHVQGVNAQAIVTADQCIVSADITQDENDVHQLKPMLARWRPPLRQPGSRIVPRRWPRMRATGMISWR